MGTSRAIPVTVEMKSMTASSTFGHTPAEWRTRTRGQAPGYGAPTLENLTKYVKKFEESTASGGCNEHLGVSVVTSAFIKDQRTGKILATYKGPEVTVFG